MVDAHAEIELDESMMFDGDAGFDSPPAVAKELGVAEVPAAPTSDTGGSPSDSDDEDGIVLSISSSSSGDSEGDEVEMRLRERISSLHSSLGDLAETAAAPVNELSTSHGGQSHVGSLRSFGSGAEAGRSGKRMFGSDSDLLAASLPVTTPLHAGRRRVVPEPSYQQHAYNLGTSMPISIPMMQRRSSLSSAGEDNLPGGAATFVPPHLLQRSASTAAAAAEVDLRLVPGSQPGGSPSNDLKREKLKARNAILRRTGFIEAQPVALAPGAELLEPVRAAAMATDLVAIGADGDSSNLSSSDCVPLAGGSGGAAAPVPVPGGGSLEARLRPSSLSALLGTSK